MNLKDLFINLLGNINPTVLYILIVMLIIAGIISIVKKLIHIAIAIAMVALIISVLAPAARNIKSLYDIRVEDDKIVVTVMDSTIKINKDIANDIEIKKENAFIYELRMASKGNDKVYKLPKFLVDKLLEFSNSLGLSLKLSES